MKTNNLVYDLYDRPKFSKLIVYSFQMLLAILAATIAVPTIIGLPAQIPAAILGAGVGTLVYVLFTRGRSPVMLSSSFAFLSAFPTAIAFGYMGIVLGGLFAGLIYVIIAIVIKFVGTKWLEKLLPPVIIGPVVALIGLSLATSAMGDITKATGSGQEYNLVALLCGLVAFFTIVIISNQQKKPGLKLIPFIIGIGAGYAVASIFTAIGNACHVEYLKIIKWDALVENFKEIKLQSFLDYPRIALVEAIKELQQGHVSEAIQIAAGKSGAQLITPVGVAQVALAFCPIAFVTLAEHIADHKNISRIINRDLLNESPGLHRTLLGDGVGSIAGTACGICPNTTYGESVACVAMTRNASVITTFTTAIMCIILAFLTPFNKLLATIPNCVMGGVCLTLYGFIAVSGLRMFKDINLDDNVNLMTVSAILIAGIGGLAIKIPYQISGQGEITATINITSIATALILGICTYQIASRLAKRKAGGVDAIDDTVKVGDYYRQHLKTYSPATLAKAVNLFGFQYENVDYAASTLTNLMKSKTQLSLLDINQLKTLVKLLEIQGERKSMSKNQYIDLIVKNSVKIDKSSTKHIVGQEIN